MTSTQMRADRDALSVADVLDRAADLITPEGAWTQGALGRDADGEAIHFAGRIEEAVCFCAAGALWKAAHGSSGKVFQAFDVLTIGGRIGGIGSWNDSIGRTQGEVVNRLREAATIARGQGL